MRSDEQDDVFSGLVKLLTVKYSPSRFLLHSTFVMSIESVAAGCTLYIAQTRVGGWGVTTMLLSILVPGTCMYYLCLKIGIVLVDGCTANPAGMTAGIEAPIKHIRKIVALDFDLVLHLYCSLG